MGRSWPVPSLAPQEWVSCVFLALVYAVSSVFWLCHVSFSLTWHVSTACSQVKAEAEGHHRPFSWPCRACNAHEKPRCGGYGGYIWESLLPRTMTCGSSSTDDAQGSSCASSAQTSLLAPTWKSRRSSAHRLCSARTKTPLIDCDGFGQRNFGIFSAP